MLLAKAKGELAKGARFVSILAVVGTLSYVAVSAAMPQLQWLTAVLSSFALSAIGISAKAVMGSPPLLVGIFMLSVEIAALCVGDVEIAVLLGGIAATEDRTLRERLGGMFAGLFFVLLINPVRISLTLAAGVWWGMALAGVVYSPIAFGWATLYIRGLAAPTAPAAGS